MALWKRDKLDKELQKGGLSYAKVLETASPCPIDRSDVKAFVKAQIDVLTNRPNVRKETQSHKFLAIDEVKTAHSQDITFHDYLKANAPDLLDNGSFVLRLNMDMYRIHRLIVEWEDTCSTDQYRWWSNPFTNLIAYQVFHLTSIVPFAPMSVPAASEHRPVHRAEKRVRATRPTGLSRGVVVIYLIKHKRSTKAYVGQTRDYARRMHQHARVDSGCRLLRDAIQRDGIDAFDREVLAYCDAANANRVEAFFIQKHNTVTPGGYNISAGNFGFVDEEKSITALMLVPDVDPVDVSVEILEHLRDVRDFRDSSETRQMIKRQILANHPDTSANPDAEKCSQLYAKLQQLRETARH
jgi:hypothetical protein